MQFVRRLIYLIFTIILLSACGAFNTSDDTNPNKIVYGLTQSIVGLDPHLHASDELNIILRQIYDTLVYRHPDTHEIVPGLAQSWEISEDRLNYTFYLREDVVFHDGTPLTAQAVSDNLERILNPDLQTDTSRQLLGPIISFQVVGSHSIRLTLSRPFEPLLDSLSQTYLAIISPSAMAEYQATPLRYQFHQVGTGPFMLVEYVPEDRVVLRRNPNYSWYPSFYRPPANPIQEIEFRFFRDASERLPALMAGDAQIMGGLLPPDARSVNNEPDITVIPTPISGQPLQFYFNTTQPPTDNLAVRQALVYAANRTSIAESIYGGFSPVAWGPIAASGLYYNRGVRNVYAYNLQQAQALLGQAGYTDDNDDGLLERDGEALAITLIHPPQNQLSQVALFLQEQWESIGIQVRVRPVPNDTSVVNAALEDDYNLLAVHESGFDPYIINRNFLSNVRANWTGFGSPELDTVLMEAEAITDVEERRLAYGRAQAIILEQALILPVSDVVRLNAHTSAIAGLQYDVFGAPMLFSASINN